MQFTDIYSRQYFNIYNSWNMAEIYGDLDLVSAPAGIFEVHLQCHLRR